MILRINLICLLLVFLGSIVKGQMVTGTYTGDGTSSQSITGLGGDPTVLFIIPESGEEPFVVTGSMPSGNAKLTSADGAVDEEFQTDLITSLDADGFTVQANANTSSKVYYYIAWDEFNGDVVEGTFIGSTSSQTVNPGFQPEMVWVFANNSASHENMKLMMSSSPTSTLYFSNGTAGFGGFVFDGVGAGGFDVLASGASGSGVQDGVTYYYVAFNSGSENDFGSASIGFSAPSTIGTTNRPDFIFARHNSTLGNNGFVKTVDMPSNTSYTPRGAAPSISTSDLLNIDASSFDVGSGGQLRSDLNYYTFPAYTLLPVDLIDFRGALIDEFIQLTWKTASEINSETFIVERSSDGVSFEEIGRVDAAGNSSVERAYQFIDNQPLEGNNYYRLKQVDFDGAFEYHKIIVINTVTQASLTRVNVFPNPADDIVRFNVSSEESKVYRVEILDKSGRLVKVETVNSSEGQQTITVDISTLAPGNYALNLIDEETGFKIGRLIKK